MNGVKMIANEKLCIHLDQHPMFQNDTQNYSSYGSTEVSDDAWSECMVEVTNTLSDFFEIGMFCFKTHCPVLS